MVDKTDQKDFLGRWSARKLAGGEPEKAAAPVAVTDTEDAGDAEIAAVDAPPPDLPDVETLNADSDFTAFLGDNVPKDIAKLAFRKLWRSDPVLANIDGLNDYDDDYSMIGKVVEVVKSSYQVGKGYVTDEDDIPEEEILSDASEAEKPETDAAEDIEEEVGEENGEEIPSEEPAELADETSEKAELPSERQPAKPEV